MASNLPRTAILLMLCVRRCFGNLRRLTSSTFTGKRIDRCADLPARKAFNQDLGFT
ncbi:hypothetical protein RHMOL_Rhmol04G0031500 [Rhododendron molle]|uniref:Uncharacterized protein n=1 Tax=Rhododendron molle TaxID=49168 RepID=A0ACC0NY86_RHOML|nr:hypothetical protein RHMOL_Rhmol04G0031500 [Rhododendron molle]